jgi:hypothetical protein
VELIELAAEGHGGRLVEAIRKKGERRVVRRAREGDANAGSVKKKKHPLAFFPLTP